MTARTRLGVLVCALTLTLTACGGASAEKKPPKDAPAATTAVTGSDFCDQLVEARRTFALMNVTLATDWSAFDAASDQLAAVKPPAEVASRWKVVADFYAHVADLFEGVDFSDRGAVGDAVKANLGPETESRAKQAQSAIADVEKYATSNCDDSGDVAAVTDACTLLKDDELKRVFPTGLPKPTSRTYGPDTMECIWRTDAAEASIMIVPIGDFKREYLDKSTPMPTGEIDGLEGGDTFKGILGIGRFNTRGHSVSFIHGKVGGFVGVRHGAADSRPADVGTAAKLAKMLVARL